MNEQMLVPKPEEVDPTLKSPDEMGLPSAETLKSDAMPNENDDVSTLINENEMFSQSGTLRSTEESDVPVESGIKEKSHDSISGAGAAPISSEIISDESYRMDETSEKPLGFKLRVVPEWESTAKGISIVSQNENTPDNKGLYEDKGDGALRSA